MSQENRYDALFEPVRIGPVTSKNRFYQVPHCSGMGHALPRTLAAMRGMKAEGGWGVVCTEYCSIHPSSDDHPYPFASNWDEDDLAPLTAIADAIHAHGALAGIELWHGGSFVANLASRVPALGVRSMPSRIEPIQSQRMDDADLRRFRGWHLAAARRARRAGFDIVYVYPTHGYLVSEFLSRSLNQRADEYGGTLENRSRLLRELLEETRAAIGDRCAVAVRFSAEGHGEEHLSAEEARELMASLGPLADLWDVVVADYYGEEMASSRFVKEGALEAKVAQARALTGRPVVGVGRFTSPDTMLSQVRRGVLDLIGAARPSIADPFLPSKIREGRLEEIRECIGCNICYAHNFRGAAIRCTQNPTMGEEWRRGWHPERFSPAAQARRVLVVGAGPAGLEAARVLGRRGFEVTLAEATEELGGRVRKESAFPGLSEWIRVRDYRVQQLRQMRSVSIYLGHALSAADVEAFDADHVLLATGARWRRDGCGRWHVRGITTLPERGVFTPDDLFAGARPSGEVVVFDDDHYYLGPVLSQWLALQGAQVTYVTTEARAGSWSQYTGEQERTQRQLIEHGVEIIVSTSVDGFDGQAVSLSCTYSGRTRQRAAGALLLITSREPDDELYRALTERAERALPEVARIGDCCQPALIAHAVYAGYKAAVELGQDLDHFAAARDRGAFAPRMA